MGPSTLSIAHIFRLRPLTILNRGSVFSKQQDEAKLNSKLLWHFTNILYQKCAIKSDKISVSYSMDQRKWRISENQNFLKQFQQWTVKNWRIGIYEYDTPCQCGRQYRELPLTTRKRASQGELSPYLKI